VYRSDVKIEKKQKMGFEWRKRKKGGKTENCWPEPNKAAEARQREGRERRHEKGNVWGVKRLAATQYDLQKKPTRSGRQRKREGGGGQVRREDGEERGQNWNGPPILSIRGAVDVETP